MNKKYTSLGLMSGTSGDGVDASIIRSDGKTFYEVVINRYFEYDNEIFEKIHLLKEKINTSKDLSKFNEEVRDLERQITLFHAKISQELCREKNVEIVGFHGQTIFHNPAEKISKQLGDGYLLSSLTKKNVVFNFRQNDLKNGGEGAPLTPIFHQLIATQNNLEFPVCILNIGGISNITIVEKSNGKFDLKSRDIGPGNCLIDSWVRKNSNKKFDEDGTLAAKGNYNEIIGEQAEEFLSNIKSENKLSFDVSDFDVSFVRGLSLEDGATTLTKFTAKIISSYLSSITLKRTKKELKIFVCGGGRKNKELMEKIQNNICNDYKLTSIDNYGVDGDFVESQAFAFLAIRSILNLPISFPNTTGCKDSTNGGQLVKIK